MTQVINLIGAPGAGKSTLAAGLFHEMKRSYMSVELVTEYAKDLTYDGQSTENMDQLSVFAEQHRRIARLIGKVDYVITDSPLYLSAYYASKTDTPLSFRDYVMSMANRYHNLNYLVTRNHRYDPNGRSQDEAGADKIHNELIFFMDYWSIPFTKVLAGDDQPVTLFNQLFKVD
jgi:hypothetical protein